MNEYTIHFDGFNCRPKGHQPIYPINQKRKSKGVYYSLVAELLEDEERFRKYFQTTRKQFTQILNGMIRAGAVI